MRSIKFSLSKKPENAWEAAALLIEAYFSAGVKADQVLEKLPDNFIGQPRARCQSLFLGALRHGHRCRAAYRPFLKKRPRPLVEAVLMLAGYEFCTEEKERHPKIVHYAVERSKALVSRHEQGFINAVLRKLPAAIASIDEQSALAAFYSHPDWLALRWVKDFGLEDTRALLCWNQQIPEHMLRIYGTPPDELPDFLESSEWEGFYRITRKAGWMDELEPLLKCGSAYIKDPSTRIAPALLAPTAGSDVLDLCAAPGGKSYELANEMNHHGRIVAVDLPGKRIGRLKDNLAKLEKSGIHTSAVECDLLELNATKLSNYSLPARFDAVMLDAPCTNTGVIQRRIDVKWRLKPKDISQCAQLQLQLLQKAADFVKPSGRIVYSTCSIDPDENRNLVNTFLSSNAGKTFTLIDAVVSLPWKSGHDGAGAFLMKRAG